MKYNFPLEDAKTKDNRIICLGMLIMLIMCIFMTGCHAQTEMLMSEPAAYEDTGATAASGGQMNRMAGVSNEMAMDATADYSTDYMADGDSGAQSGETGAALSESELEAAEATAKDKDLDISRKLIRTVNISAQTTEFDTVNDSISNSVEAFGGYLENSNVYGDSYYSGSYYVDSNRYAYYTIRVPADKLNEFLDTALDALHVVSRSENVEDITLRYTDLESKVKALETEQERLYELMSKADSVDAMVSIETRLSEIRYELESIQSSLRVYDNQVVYSTIYLNVEEVKITSTTNDAGFVEKVKTGLSKNILSLKENAEAALIGFISSLPTIIVVITILAAAVMIARKIYRYISRKRRNEKTFENDH